MKLEKLIKDATVFWMNEEVRKIKDQENHEIWEVGKSDDYKTVEFVTKKGFSYLSCGCKCGTRHPLANPECKHKLAVRMFEERRLFIK